MFDFEEKEKSLELGTTNLSNTYEVELDSTIEDIIPQENYNKQEENDPFATRNDELEVALEDAREEFPELTELQQLFEEMDISLEDGKEYRAEITGVKNNKGILNIYFNACVKGLNKEIRSSYFFSSRDCSKLSIGLIKDLSNLLGIEVSKDDFETLDTITSLCEKFVGKKVIIVQRTRNDEKTGKYYQNYDVVKPLNNDLELGGNL